MMCCYTPPGIPDAVLSLAQFHLGDVCIVRECSHTHGVSQVWEIQSQHNHQRYFLKQYHQARRFTQENVFYTTCAPAIAHSIPDRIAFTMQDGFHAMLLTALPGEIVEQATLDSMPLLDVYQQAGAWLRMLHDQPFIDHDPIPLSKAVPMRLQNWCEQARSSAYIESRDLEHACAIIQHNSVFDRSNRVPCHRDFSPRNWIWESTVDDTAGALGVIDFDHYRPDAMMWDFIRVVDEYAAFDSPRWRAFIKGYGRPLSDVEQAQLAQLSLINAIGTIIWACQYDDRPFEAWGRRILAQRLHTFTG